jgi:hypothetical protein
LNKLSKTHQSNQRTKSSKGYEVKPYYSCRKKNIISVFLIRFSTKPSSHEFSKGFVVVVVYKRRNGVRVNGFEIWRTKILKIGEAMSLINVPFNIILFEFFEF